jgi:RNA polymerase sigma-70 factor (ECF subfamily)
MFCEPSQAGATWHATGFHAPPKLQTLPGWAYGPSRVDDRDRDYEDIRAVANGDQAALGRLYDRHASLMLAVAHRILRNQREAEDILHDVFLEAWRRSGSYDPSRSGVRSWLLLLTRSRALDRVKAAGFARSRPLGDDFDLAADSPEIEGVDSKAVRAALADLPPDQRSVLMLGYFGGLSCSEIADELGIPIGTVKSRVKAALEKLRAALGDVEARR